MFLFQEAAEESERRVSRESTSTRNGEEQGEDEGEEAFSRIDDAVRFFSLAL